MAKRSEVQDGKEFYKLTKPIEAYKTKILNRSIRVFGNRCFISKLTIDEEGIITQGETTESVDGFSELLPYEIHILYLAGVIKLSKKQEAEYISKDNQAILKAMIDKINKVEAE